MIANWDLWLLRVMVGLIVLLGLGGLLFLILIEIGWLPGGI